VSWSLVFYIKGKNQAPIFLPKRKKGEVGEWPEHKTQKEKEKGWEVIYIQTGKKKQKTKEKRKKTTKKWA
jgi:hypothetical protein